MAACDFTTLDAIRDELPVVTSTAYLNTGSSGPLPRRAVAALRTELQYQLERGRADFTVFRDRYLPLLADVRARFARLLHASASEIAVTHHTTEGINIVVWGIPWRAGDEIVTTTLEHQGVLLPVYAVAQRYGLTLRVVDLDVSQGAEAVAEQMAAALSPRTRLVIFSHVAYQAGAVLPVTAIARAAHEAGALVAVDGAQAAGAVSVDPRSLGADFYAFPAHKWLCGPEGCGALYVAQEHLPELAPTFVGFMSLRNLEAYDLRGHFEPGLDAGRYETSTAFWPAICGLHASLIWLEEIVGYKNVFERCYEVTDRLRTMLGDVRGVMVRSPREHVGLTTVSVASILGGQVQTLAAHLAERGIEVRALPGAGMIRISTAFFNTEEEVARLCAALSEL